MAYFYEENYEEALKYYKNAEIFEMNIFGDSYV